MTSDTTAMVGSVIWGIGVVIIVGLTAYAADLVSTWLALGVVGLWLWVIGGAIVYAS